ncbi:MAG: sulfurtransferase, partial [Anaerolineae bacterium]|nr:sulfurtransferase [Anaerolineae bacterium]
AKPERYAAVMSRLGIAPETLVVAYDDADGMFAARLWWSLLYYGHEKVVILDGGWKKWTVEGRPVTAEVPEITPSHFVARPNETQRRTGTQVSAALHQVTLLDVRSPAEYNGQASRAQRAGHIPGAINLPRTDLVRGDGTLLPPDELRRRFAALGMDETSEIITYCNGGVSASFGMLALRVAGLNHVSMYDGSWKEWGNASDKPVES